MPGDATPNLAHQIGQELCDKHLKGKYEYVITTHVDKEHIHNHIIFNNVSFVDGKAYVSNKKSYHQIRTESDQICIDHGLSIIRDNDSQKYNKTNGKSYKEYQEEKKGNSYKAKLKYAIDLAIKKSINWDDFINHMEAFGYEIKRGKHISFKAIDQERFTRAKTIGTDYSEERIIERIQNRLSGKLHHTTRQQQSPVKIVDINSNKLASESASFARWLKLQNLKNIAKTWQSINQNEVTDLDSFYAYIRKVHDEFLKTQGELKNVELEIHKTAEQIKNINTYKKYKSIYTDYENAIDKDAYFRMYEREIILFEAARESIGSPNSQHEVESIFKLKNKIRELSVELKSITTILSDQKKKISEVNDLKKNLETYLKATNEILQSNQDKMYF